MSDLTFRNLAELPLSTVHAAFLAAFADYAIPMQLDLAGLDVMLRRRGYVAELSGGVFLHDTLVGFHLIGRGQWHGVASCYDIASGVLPAARGQRLSQRLFDWLAPQWRAAGLAQCLLEVMVQNDVARRSYLASGFVPVRELDCLQWAAKPAVRLPPGVVGVLEVGNDWPEEYAPWLDTAPSWQNSPAALAATPQPFSRLRLVESDRTVALACFNPARGEVVLFAVDPAARRRGLGAALLTSVAQACEGPLRLINLQEGSAAQSLLRKLGAVSTTRQLEMCWRLSPA